ncbi:MAG: SMI1/KNR4 family protein [Ruminococcus sp.]
MSYKTLKKAMKIAKKCDGYDCGDGISNAVLERAQELLGVTFSRQLSEYLKKYGWIEFYGVEIYGITNPELSSDVYEGCLVEWTLHERETSGLPQKWVAIRFEDDGMMAFLDFGNCDEDGEPRVILAENQGSGYVELEELAEDLGDYLLELAEDALEG